MGAVPVSTYRFADVELDVDRFDVTRAGRRLSLEPKAIEVLRFLVERPGRLVTKDELLDGVWADVAVTPNALTRVVAQLRRELGDDAADARIIETVPTRGYRFIAEIHRERLAETTRVDVKVAPAHVPPAPTPLRRRRWLTALAAAVVVAGLAGVWALRRPAAGDGAARPLAGESGSILDVAFSPDGRWLALVSDRSGAFEIYLRDLAAPTSRPLTTDGMRNVHPAWSPDSTRIAFHSGRRKGVWVMAIDGGAARQLSPFGSRPAWSPDGRWIAFQSDEFVSEFAQPGSHLLLVPADGSGPARALTRAGEPPGGHGAPLWSPDGSTVYFGTARNGPTDFWSVRVRDGLLTQRAESWQVRVLGLTDSPSGVVAWGVERPFFGVRLLRLGVGDGPSRQSTVPDLVLDGLPSGVRAGSIAPGGRVAALALVEPRDEVWTVPITAAGAPAGEPRRLRAGGHPAISPDGRRIAYDFGPEIRVMDVDGGNDRQVVGGGRRAMYPTWRSNRAIFALRLMGLSPFLVEADLETGTVTERLPLPQATSFPRVAPDGDTVVATLGEPLNRVGRGSLAARTFEPWPLFDGYSFPVWSPDGRRLALEKKVGAQMAMFVADAATGQATQVSPDDGQSGPAASRPMDAAWRLRCWPGPASGTSRCSSSRPARAPSSRARPRRKSSPAIRTGRHAETSWRSTGWRSAARCSWWTCRRRRSRSSGFAGDLRLSPFHHHFRALGVRRHHDATGADPRPWAHGSPSCVRPPPCRAVARAVAGARGRRGGPRRAPRPAGERTLDRGRAGRPQGPSVAVPRRYRQHPHPDLARGCAAGGAGRAPRASPAHAVGGRVRRRDHHRRAVDWRPPR